MLRIDGMIKLMLEQHRIPYLPVESASMQERARAVDFVLKRVAGLSAIVPTTTDAGAPKVVTLLNKVSTSR